MTEPSPDHDAPDTPSAPAIAEYTYTDAYSRVTLRIITPDQGGGAALTLAFADDLNRHEMGVELDAEVWQQVLEHVAPLVRYAAAEQAANARHAAETAAADQRERFRRAFDVRAEQSSRWRRRAVVHLADCSLLTRNQPAPRANSDPFETVAYEFHAYRQAMALYRAAYHPARKFGQELVLCGRCKPLGSPRTAEVNALLARLPTNGEDENVIDGIVTDLRALQDAHETALDQAESSSISPVTPE